MTPFVRRCLEFDSHYRTVLAIVIAGTTFAVASLWLRPPVSIIVGWDSFAFASLLFAWAGMLTKDAKTCLSSAHRQDSTRVLICGCTILAAIAGLFGGGMLLAMAKNLQGSEFGIVVALAAVTVLLSWLLVHTMLALHYTHVCCHIAERSKSQPADLGILIPGESQPDFVDFAYFAFVIGMTCQVSDIQVTSRRVRRLVLMHGILSFGFNTVVLAMSLNLASQLF